MSQAGVRTSGPFGEADRSGLDDQGLLQAHINGDPYAFGELVRRHRDRLWGVAMRTLRDREEAADALQDALISAMRKAASYRSEATVTTWLHRVVVNACLDRLRRERARPHTPLGDLEVTSRVDDHAELELRLDLHAALARLPEAQRAAIVLVDLLEWSVADTAAELGVAEGTVKSRCSRGRTELARILSDRLPYPQSARRLPTSGPNGGNQRPRPRVAGADVRMTGPTGPAGSGGRS
jgi:RNA polymerase sigma-70 factor (ECF subfamily)